MVFQEEERVELVEKCCPGFYEIGNKCRPKCSSCLHGTCMKNQQCDCKAGYQGKNCDTRTFNFFVLFMKENIYFKIYTFNGHNIEL